jgi:hypothetical protein
MWFLNFIPDLWLRWFVHGVVALGLIMYVIGYFKSFPIIGSYADIARQLGTLTLLAGIWFEGGYGVEMSYRAKIAEMQKEIDSAKEQAKEVNDKIESKVVEKVKIIKEQTNEINRDIETNRDNINAVCKLSDDAWVLYNRATKNALAGSTK